MVTGITGMVGSTIAHECVESNKVIGVVRRTSNRSLGRLDKAGLIGRGNLILESGDLTDYSSLYRIIRAHKPDIIINCGASSHVGESFKTPLENLQITGAGCANLLEAVRNNQDEVYNPYFVQFSTSEMFGGNFSRAFFEYEANDGPSYPQHYNIKYENPRYNTMKDLGICGEAFQNEQTPLSANSPYAAAKIYAHNMTELYREAYGMNCISLIAFNMEGPARGETFVTRKITKYVAALDKWSKQVKQVVDHKKYPYGTFSCLDEEHIAYTTGSYVSQFPKLKLGNINSVRDWTHVSDSIRAIPTIINNGGLGPYCVCSNQTHSVKEFIEEAFSVIKVDKDKCMDYILIDQSLIRPCEVPFLRGDSTKLRELGWEPKVGFGDLVKEMVLSDILESSLL